VPAVSRFAGGRAERCGDRLSTGPNASPPSLRIGAVRGALRLARRWLCPRLGWSCAADAAWSIVGQYQPARAFPGRCTPSNETPAMKQILQSLTSGRAELADIPCPAAPSGALLIATRCSLVSAGTERMLVDFGRANLLDKARQQPDKVRQVLEKVRTDGLAPTLEAVRDKLDRPLALGYCNAGTVVAVGPGVEGFAVGDRVASNGKHAEVVAVPKHLCAQIPQGVGDEHAAFAVIGAIALQGIRLLAPTLGERVAVTGLGLIGLIAVQLLRANGCRVLGIDFDPARLELARRFGAQTVDLGTGQDPIQAADAWSQGRGVDGVLIAASTKSNAPVAQAARMCRQRGRIVLVGVTGLTLSRADFYEKELSFQVSCSYGPGRYDPQYEEQGYDYPFGLVRWTEQRNLEAVLELMASGALDLEPLISHRFPIAQAQAAYAQLADGGDALGILLTYPQDDESGRKLARSIPLPQPAQAPAPADAPRIGFIGTGNYAGRVLIPAFKAAGATLVSTVSSNGVSGVHFGRKHGFAESTTDAAALLADDALNTVVVATRHDSHADYVLRAIAAGKHCFVEKPLCLTLAELDAIAGAIAGRRAAGAAVPLLTVGFNRRFAPQVQRIKSLLDGIVEPKSFVMTVNAGATPATHWTQDPAIGGGRVVGEACHFIDLLRFLAGAPVMRWQATFLGGDGAIARLRDNLTLTLAFADGSIGTVHYLARGSKSFPKERLEVFAGGGVLQLDNFRRLQGLGWPGFKRMNLWRQDKGQSACARAFVDAIRCGGPAPIPLDEILEVSRIAIEIAGTGLDGPPPATPALER
jgi:predicted dehydrogenase/threonine dehydrogenase-like Zn-dependent dehydrogenase